MGTGDTARLSWDSALWVWAGGSEGLWGGQGMREGVGA